MALIGTASTVTTFLVCMLAAQTAELCCEAAPELTCLQTEVYRQIEKQLPVPIKMLGFCLASKGLLLGEFPTSGT